MRQGIHLALGKVLPLRIARHHSPCVRHQHIITRERLELLPGVFDQQLYALAMPAGSRLREPLNEAVLRLTESADWRLIQRAYLGEQL